MSLIGGATGSINRVGNALRHGEASFNAYRNQRQIARGHFGRHNPTYVTQGSNGDLVVRNVQTGQDRNALTGERSSSGSVDLPSVPTSVSDVLGTVADWYYEEEIQRLQGALNQISTRVAGMNRAAEVRAVREAVSNFQNKINEYHTAVTGMQRRAMQRRTDYLELGVALDNFARANPETVGDDKTTFEGDERYATILTLTASVREMLAIMGGADPRGGGGSLSSSALEAWFNDMKAAREADPPAYRERTFHLGQQETERINQIYQQTGGFENKVDYLRGRFGGIDAAAGQLMAALNPGAGGAAAQY